MLFQVFGLGQFSRFRSGAAPPRAHVIVETLFVREVAARTLTLALSRSTGRGDKIKV